MSANASRSSSLVRSGVASKSARITSLCASEPRSMNVRPHVAQNLVESYRWLSLAAAAGGPTAIPAKSMLNDLERQMPDADLAKAQQLVKSKSTN